MHVFFLMDTTANPYGDYRNIHKRERQSLMKTLPQLVNYKFTVLLHPQKRPADERRHLRPAYVL
jgi:hypothetical protein